MVASEARPFASTGGLAEVVGGLPQALARLGHTVTVFLPNYRRTLSTTSADNRRASIPPRDQPTGNHRVVLDFGSRRQEIGFVLHRLGDRVTAVLIDAPELYERPGLYGTAAGDYSDNAYRFAVLSRGALEYVRRQGVRPSVIHAHDWQTGLVPAYQKMLFATDPIVGGVPAVFTVHNLAFQGLFPSATLPEIGLPWDVLHVHAMEFWGQISFLKAGINFSERLTTVSPSYAREVLNPELGFGFDGILSRRADSFVGILNGIDNDRWNPAADPFLQVPFGPDDMTGKRAAKRQLLEAVRLPADDDALMRPVIGLVSRLTDQKGFDLISESIHQLMAFDATWVLLGSGEQCYEQQWRQLADRYPLRVSTTVGFDDRLEHLIEAGADAFLMPSRFEPCGLNQLNCLRYGTLPIVRATGGLDDTVRDAARADGTGFKFADFTPAALVAALGRVLDTYRKPSKWKKLQRTAMRQDYSWDVSAREYVKVYRATT